MIVLTEAQLREVVAAYRKFPAWAFDVETKGSREPKSKSDQPALDVITNEVTWVALAGPGRADVIPLGHHIGEELEPERKEKEAWYDESQPTKSGRGKKKWRTITIPAVYGEPPKQLRPGVVFSALEPLFFPPEEEIPRRIIGHNIKFDLETVAKYYGGALPLPPYGDTLTLLHIVNENLPQKGLKQATKKIFDFEYEAIGKNVNEVPFSRAARYARLDAKYTWLLWLKLRVSLDRQGLGNIFDLDMDVLHALARSELVGAPIDLSRHAELKRALEREIEEHTAALWKYAGKQWDINSQPQQGEYVYEILNHKVVDWTKGGKTGTNKRPSTAEEALAKFAKKDPAVQRLMDYKEAHKLYSTYVDGIGQKISDDGRVHANFTLHVARTGRLSCTEPNLHNIPRPDGDNASTGTLIRGMFIPPPGQVMVVCDYGQQEYRVLAHFSKDPAYLDIFINHPDLDPHVMTACILFGLEPEEVTKAQRTVAKNTGFAISYGAGPDKVAAMSKVTLKQAKDTMNKHQKTFPGIYTWIEQTKREARRRKPVPYVETLLGRRRRLPALYAQDRGARGQAERQAVNSIIQGSAAEITKLAIVRLDHMLPEGMEQILNVHDELVVTAPAERADEATRVVQEAMVGEEMQKLLRVPLAADPMTVTRWSDAKG